MKMLKLFSATVNDLFTNKKIFLKKKSIFDGALNYLSVVPLLNYLYIN